MNNIPIEILERVFITIVENAYPRTERFPTLTPASKKGILSARAIWSNYRREDPPRELFLGVLEQMPFTVSGSEDERGQISGLRAMSESEYANGITTLSFCPMVFDRELSTAGWPPNTQHVLASIFRRFPRLEHVRLYTLPTGYTRGGWLESATDRSYVWQATITDPDGSVRSLEQCERPELQAGKYFGDLQHCLSRSNIQTLTMPSCGNLGSFCALPSENMTINHPMFAESLRRVSINLTVHSATIPVIGGWTYHCPNLEYLEIALSRPPNVSHESGQPQRLWLPHDHRSGNCGQWMIPARLTELRLIADTSFCTCAHMPMVAIRQFPNLKKLALAHFIIQMSNWSTFLGYLRDHANWRVNLDVLWLLNPFENLQLQPSRSYIRFEDKDDDIVGAAEDATIMHRPCAWGGDQGLVRGVGRGYTYEAFGAFEKVGGGDEAVGAS